MLRVYVSVRIMDRIRNENEIGGSVGVLWGLIVDSILACSCGNMESIDEDVTVIRKTEKRSGTTFLCVMGCFGVGIQKGMNEMSGLE